MKDSSSDAALHSKQVNGCGKPMIRILIADGHPIVREGLRHVIQQEKDFELIGEAEDGSMLLGHVSHLNPDILIMELKLPHLDGFAAIRTLQLNSPQTRILLFTASESKDDFVEAMKLGCSGIVLKNTPVDLIAKSIRKVQSGEIWLDSNTTAAVMRQFATTTEYTHQNGKFRERTLLSQREREIIVLIAQGYKNKEIAEKMFITEQTVKNHLHNVFDKLGVSDRLELALYAIHNSLHVKS